MAREGETLESEEILGNIQSDAVVLSVARTLDVKETQSETDAKSMTVLSKKNLELKQPFYSLQALPEVLLQNIFVYLDAEKRARFSAVSISMQQMSLQYQKYNMIRLYTHVFIPKHSSFPYGSRLSLSLPLTSLDLVGFLSSDIFLDPFFYTSADAVREHANASMKTWSKVHQECAIVSYQIEQHTIYDYDANKMKRDFTSEYKLSAALCFKVKRPFISLFRSSFSPLPHRLSLVAQINKREVERKPLDKEIDPVLDDLKTAAYLAQRAYKKWFQGEHFIRLSFWNHHGGAGQERADHFNKRVQACATRAEALTVLREHLDRREGCFKNRGRLADHSFDTFLLREISDKPLLVKKEERFGKGRWKLLCDTKNDRAKLREKVLSHLSELDKLTPTKLQWPSLVLSGH